MSEEEGTLKNVAPTWFVLSGHQHQVGVDKHGDLKKSQVGIRKVHQETQFVTLDGLSGCFQCINVKKKKHQTGTMKVVPMKVQE